MRTSGHRAELDDADDGGSDEAPPIDAAGAATLSVGTTEERAARKTARKRAKAARRAAREGRADEDAGRKSCERCAARVDLLIRCQ